jgi:cytochrome c oxidase cbb3-type subunit 3
MPTKDQKDLYATEAKETGHEWDGITEYDNPLPKWWLYVFFTTIVFAIGYCVLYPSVPLIWTHTNGVFAYNRRAEVSQAEAAAAAQQAPYRDRIAKLSLADIRKDPELLIFAETGGRAVFAENCVPCHRAGGAGAKGYPNLVDDDWLWGGKIETIEQTITHGIRNADPDSRQTNMPRFGADGILTRAQISDVADYVLSISGRTAPRDAVERGRKVFSDNCVTCHGADGKGDQSVGAKNLTDNIWLYGGDKASIVETVTNARNGSMPAWGQRFDATTIKMLTLYVYSLGGGQ